LVHHCNKHMPNVPHYLKSIEVIEKSLIITKYGDALNGHTK